MIMDLCPSTLMDTMKSCNFALSDQLIADVFSCVCHGVAHMHQHDPPMAHRWAGAAGRRPGRCCMH